jgi:hypothetical protein
MKGNTNFSIAFLTINTLYLKKVTKSIQVKSFFLNLETSI